MFLQKNQVYHLHKIPLLLHLVCLQTRQPPALQQHHPALENQLPEFPLKHPQLNQALKSHPELHQSVPQHGPAEHPVNGPLRYQRRGRHLDPRLFQQAGPPLIPPPDLRQGLHLNPHHGPRQCQVRNPRLGPRLARLLFLRQIRPRGQHPCPPPDRHPRPPLDPRQDLRPGRRPDPRLDRPPLPPVDRRQCPLPGQRFCLPLLPLTSQPLPHPLHPAGRPLLHRLRDRHTFRPRSRLWSPHWKRLPFPALRRPLCTRPLCSRPLCSHPLCSQLLNSQRLCQPSLPHWL